LIEELRLIAGIDVHAEKLLQLVLCGQSELLEILDGQQLAAMRQRVAVWQRLRPLNNTEATAYIVDRLRSAGLASPGGLFAPDAMAYVTEISNGTPRLINLICDTALTLAWEKRISQITPELVHAAGVNLNLNLQRPLAAAAPVSSTNGNGSQRRSLQVQAAAGMDNR
jgi:general secretion pathway protein A